MNHHRRPWPDLPPDILITIANRLQFADYVRFSVVCKPWRLITADTPHLRALQLPWLVILNNSTLLSPLPDHQVLHHRNLPPFDSTSIRECTCLGSSKGCLVLSHMFQGIHLSNPFTAQTIDLPNCDDLEWDAYRKIILSSNPFSSAGVEQCIAVAMCGPKRLAFCRPGGQNWAVDFSPPNCLLKDALFYKGVLLCVTDSHNLIAYQFDSGSGPKVTYQASGIAVDFALVHPIQDEMHLVEFAGELMLVIRIYHFRAYKLDFRTQTWIEVESLGDKMLLLNEVCLMCVDAAEFIAAGFRPNCIYFTEDEYEWHEFCFEDKEIRPFSPASSYSIKSPLLWINPIM